ncbi:hypothetical protein F442_22758 [Phytophthora nicotianae P10297]|uniref:DDE Tnp4 domain-containing protein n=1 Tax=Phytophthora nicotianae P10297 TaxID=1317064 RepID=W2XZ19_PHYNI|nr:hypothetical protein F442_22758 [Phytophthora nicotianae P10297]
MSPSQEDGNDVLLVVRQLTSSVRRHHKAVVLFRLWRQAMDEGNAVISAALFSFLATELPVEAARRAPYNFNSLSNDQCVERFRFTKVQIVELVTLFGLEGIRTRERAAATGAEGLCILLDSSGLSNIFLHMLTRLDDKYAKLLYFNESYVVQNLQAYADDVFDAGGLLQNVWAFIDGTARGICRPRPRHTKRDGKFMSQKSVYNGHKRKHALKYQTLTTPDGLIAHLYGPFPGRNHDIKLFKDSKISERIRNDSRFQQYKIYGDQAYGNDDVLTSPYAGAVGNLSREQRQVNVSMSRVRVSVEWSHGQVTNYWTALAFKRQARVGIQPVGLMFRVGVFLTNCITCTQGGNTISDYFGLAPPSLSVYLNTR